MNNNSPLISGGLVGAATREEQRDPHDQEGEEAFSEGLRNFTVAASALVDAVKTKGADRLHHHTEEVILKTLGSFPRDSEGYEVVRWTLLMERCLTANKVEKMQDILRILYRIILDPNITNKFREAFLSSTPPVFTDDEAKPENWRSTWPFPITDNMDNMVHWAARFLLATCVPLEILREIVRELAPTRQKQDESYPKLKRRINTLKSLATSVSELFPGDHFIHGPEAYEHFLFHELDPEIERQVTQALDSENRIKAALGFTENRNRANNKLSERATIVKTITNQLSKKTDGSKLGSTTPMLAEYIHSYTGDLNYESYKEQQADLSSSVEIKILKDRLEVQSQVIAEKEKMLSNIQLSLPSRPATSFYNAPNNGQESSCYKCGNPGHLGYECPEGKTCYNCGNRGHIAIHCPQNRQPQPSTHMAQDRNRQMQQTYFRPPPFCGNCRSEGHTARRCPNPPSRPCRYCQGAHFNHLCPFAAQTRQGFANHMSGGSNYQRFHPYTVQPGHQQNQQGFPQYNQLPQTMPLQTAPMLTQGNIQAHAQLQPSAAPFQQFIQGQHILQPPPFQAINGVQQHQQQIAPQMMLHAQPPLAIGTPHQQLAIMPAPPTTSGTQFPGTKDEPSPAQKEDENNGRKVSFQFLNSSDDKYNEIE